MLTLDEIAVALRDRRMDIVAEATGLHRSTIARIKTGKANPTYDVMKALSDYLEGRA